MQQSSKQPYEPPKLERHVQYPQLIGAGISLPIGADAFDETQETP